MTDYVHIKHFCSFNSAIYISIFQYIWIIFLLVCVTKIKPVYIKERKYINAKHICTAYFACFEQRHLCLTIVACYHWCHYFIAGYITLLLRVCANLVQCYRYSILRMVCVSISKHFLTWVKCDHCSHCFIAGSITLLMRVCVNLVQCYRYSILRRVCVSI